MDPSASSHDAINYQFKFFLNFEEKWSYYGLRDFMRRNLDIPVTGVALYLAGIFLLQKYMENRKPFNVSRFLIGWNTFLAVFSICGAIRTIPLNLRFLRDHGVHHSICSEGDVGGVYGFWVSMFILSKFPELVDTVFLVLKKQRVIFLHWFHHSSVLIMTWYGNSYFMSVGRWYLVMNYTVHSCMYTYFALRAAHVRIPKVIAMFITSSQILQMVIGAAVTFYIPWVKMNGGECNTDNTTTLISAILYACYLVLFVHFFISSYLKPSGSKKGSPSPASSPSLSSSNATFIPNEGIVDASTSTTKSMDTNNNKHLLALLQQKQQQLQQSTTLLRSE